MRVETQPSTAVAVGLAGLLRLTEALGRADSAEEIYEAALDSLCDLFGADRAALLLDGDDGVERFAAARNLSEDYRRAVEERGPCGPAPLGPPQFDAQNPWPLLITDATLDPALGACRAATLDESIYALAFFPLVCRGRALGRLAVYFDLPREFAAEETSLARVVAGQVAQALGRRRAEEDWRRSETFNRRVLESSDDCIKLLDLEGRLLYMSPGGLRLIEVGEPREVIGKSWLDFWSGESRRAAEEALKAALAGGVGRFDGFCPTASGTPKWWDVIITPVNDATGRPERLLSISRDVTARRLALEELRQTTQTVEALIHACPLAVLALDNSGHVTMWNPAAERIYGWRAAEVLGRPLPTVPEELRPEFDSNTNDALCRARAFTGYETRRRRKDGTLIDVSISTSVLKDETGRVSGLVAVVEEITGRKRVEAERAELLAREQHARAEAEAASRLKDEFLATVSHELRTPLTAILGWAHLLRAGRRAGDEAERALAIIERNARAQAQLIDDLLDASRIITGKLQLDSRPLNPHAPVDAALEALKPAAEAKGVRLSQESKEEFVGLVSGDAARLQQVFWNLLSNAVKFTPPGGDVRVRIARAETEVRVSVSDTGQGIEPDFLPYVFDRFRQADATTTRAHGGLGLGLAIVRHLAELHGGYVTAESAGLNRGATFIVSLPLLAARGDEETAALRPDEGATPNDGDSERLDGLCVLIVDDEADARDLLSDLLTAHGARAVTAGSAAEALALLDTVRPDLLLSDIGMPGEDGYQLMARLRARGPERGGRTPAVALTAYAHAEDRLRALRAGFQQHVAKPINTEELIAVIARLAEQA
jgi:PAS domain S-box-containing protein